MKHYSILKDVFACKLVLGELQHGKFSSIALSWTTSQHQPVSNRLFKKGTGCGSPVPKGTFATGVHLPNEGVPPNRS